MLERLQAGHVAAEFRQHRIDDRLVTLVVAPGLGDVDPQQSFTDGLKNLHAAHVLETGALPGFVVLVVRIHGRDLPDSLRVALDQRRQRFVGEKWMLCEVVAHGEDRRVPVRGQVLTVEDEFRLHVDPLVGSCKIYGDAGIMSA